MGQRPDLSQLSDQEVVALALERKEGAWVELVLRHKERVRFIIGRQVGTEEHVEQLAQDTFFKAAMFLENYHPENSFVAWALSRLKPVPRECVEMHVLGRRTYEEIAQGLHLPVGTVKSHLDRAHKKLRALLGHVLDSSDPYKVGPLKDDGWAGEPGP